MWTYRDNTTDGQEAYWDAVLKAKKFKGDGSGLTNLSVTGSTQWASSATHIWPSVEQLSISGANVTSGTNPGHAHTDIPLNNIANPTDNVDFNFANKHLYLRFTNPSGAASGAVEIESTGAFTGDLLHIHQRVGNPGAGTHLLHATATDSDVLPIYTAGAGSVDIHTENAISGATIQAATYSGAGVSAFATSGALSSHTGDTSIHQEASVFATSGAASTNATNISVISGSYTTHQADTSIHQEASVFATSGALSTHTSDTSDPHGASITQTYMKLTSGAITSDNTASGAEVMRNVLVGTEASPGTASAYQQGTIYLKYTA